MSLTYHVENNMTGGRATKDFPTVEVANAYCRTLNTPQSGGLYGVYDSNGERV